MDGALSAPAGGVARRGAGLLSGRGDQAQAIGRGETAWLLAVGLRRHRGTRGELSGLAAGLWQTGTALSTLRRGPGKNGDRGEGDCLLPGLPVVTRWQEPSLRSCTATSRDKKTSPEWTRFSPFTGSYFVPASLYSATIYLRVSSAGPLVSSSGAASGLSGLCSVLYSACRSRQPLEPCCRRQICRSQRMMGADKASARSVRVIPGSVRQLSGRAPTRLC